jgi:hypothetical protein
MGKKKQNLNHARNMDVDAWRRREIQKRLKARLSEQTQAFISEHGSDTDEELLAYVKKAVAKKGRMPHPLEVPGGLYLVRRLGDWTELALSLGALPATAGHGRRAYLRLREREAELFAEERRAKKREKHLRAEAAKETAPQNTA